MNQVGIRLASMCLTTIGLAALASAQYSDGFEAYAVGSSINGQGGWDQWDSTGVAEGVVSSAFARTGTNSLATFQNGDKVQDWGGAYTTGQWRHSTWVYVPSTNVDPQWWVLLSNYSSGCNGAGTCFWTAQASVDPSVPEFFAQVGPSLCTGLNQFALTAPLVFDAWTEIAIEVNLDTVPQSAQLYYNGAPLGDPFNYEEGVSAGTGVGGLDTVDLYANDNVSVEEVYWDDVGVAQSSPGNVAPCLGTATTYCTAGVSSGGCAVGIGSLGTPSASHTGAFQITGTNVEPGKTGLLFYGITDATFTPLAWGGSSSFLCVKAPTQRTAAQLSGGSTGCTGSFSMVWSGPGSFMQANPGALGSPLASGQSFDAQWWYRDPPSPKTTNLSNALRWVMAP